MIKKITLILLVVLLQIGVFNINLIAEEKRKVLLLHIIEENWDDLELTLPKYDRAGEGPKPITKKEALKNYKGYKEGEENKRINDRKSFRGLKKGMTVVADEKAGAIRWIKFLLKEGNITTNTKLRIDHDIRYYGKTFLLKEEDTFMKDALRLGDIKAGYVYNEFPLKISILTEGPKSFSKQRKKFTPIYWDDFKEIRLVEDIYIVSSDKDGNLKIKYDDENYNIDAGTILELATKESDLTKEEMMKFRERYYEYYRQNYGWYGSVEGPFKSQLLQITIQKDSFHFGTKVTIINYGYVEIE